MDDTEGWGEQPLELESQRARLGHCRRAAEQLLKRCQISEPSVSIQRIAEQLAIGIDFVSLPRGVAACVRLRGDTKVIEVNERDPRVRQRFSAAHEIGHICLGHAHDDGRVSEREADIFAGALLIPRRWLKADVRTISSVAALSRRYQVSDAAMIIALTEASLLGVVRR
jgi:hypothetical protein